MPGRNSQPRARRLRHALYLTPAALAVVVLAACGSSASSSSSTATSTNSASSPTVVKSGFLTIGSEFNYPPFAFLKNGQPIGFDVDLLTDVARKLSLKPEFIKTSFATVFTAIAAGRYDTAGEGITITPKRENEVAFTIPYFETQISLVVNKKATPQVTSFSSLTSGMTVGSQTGSTDLEYAERELKPKGVGIKVYNAFPSAYLDLQAGRITGVVDDASATAAEIKGRPGLAVVQSVPSHEPYGYPVAHGANSLRTAMSKALEELFADGTFTALYEKYLPGATPPTSLPKAQG